MTISCQFCGNEFYLSQNVEKGQHVRCPYCSAKFSYDENHTASGKIKGLFCLGSSIFGNVKLAVCCVTAAILCLCVVLVLRVVSKTSTEKTILRQNPIEMPITASISSTVSHVQDVQKSSTKTNSIKRAIFQGEQPLPTVPIENIPLPFVTNAACATADVQSNMPICVSQVHEGLSDEMLNLVAKANNGDAVAQNDLGMRYRDGIGVVSNPPRAVWWFKKSAEYGNANAQVNLGICYYRGYAVDLDYRNAVRWFYKAAEQNHGLGQYNLGECYEYGRGVEKDWNAAFDYYRRSAEKGVPVAQCKLGWCYEYGMGTHKNYVLSYDWYLKAAKAGHTTAQYNLGLCYMCGRGVGKSYSEAYKWIKCAADKGFSLAQKKLRYLETVDVDFDRTKGKRN